MYLYKDNTYLVPTKYIHGAIKINTLWGKHTAKTTLCMIKYTRAFDHLAIWDLLYSSM